MLASLLLVQLSKCLVTAAAGASSSSSSSPYGPPGKYLYRVRPVLGPTRFDVTTFGAVGDNRTNDTLALQKALDACAASKTGGVVLLPTSSHAAGAGPSIYLSEPLYLTDATGCAIVLAPGATLFALAWSGPLPPFASTPRSSTARQDRLNLGSSEVSFLNIDTCISCAIGGGGTINGNGPAWWSNQDSKVRPKLISTKNSRDFALWNFTATDGGDHTIELGADDVEVAYMEIVVNWTQAFNPHGLVGGPQAPNTDGIDVHGTPFWVHHTHIDVGDDNVAVHASNVLVEDCHFGGPAFGTSAPHGHGASIGSVGSNERLENITFHLIFFENTHVGPNIKIHGDAVDGYVRNVVYEDLVIHNASLMNLDVHCDYGEGKGLEGHSGPTPAPTPTTPGNRFVVSNILFRNITATGTYKLGRFDCSDKVRCENITMVDIHSDPPRPDPNDYVCSNVTGSALNVVPPIPCLHD